MKTYIYVLRDPRDLAVRYVGKCKTIKSRYREHCATPKTTTWRDRWLLRLHAKGLQPLMEIIEVVETNGCLEERAWIKKLRVAGALLTNLTSGGEGVCGWKHSEETKLKISKAHMGRVPSAATREKLRQFNLGKKMNEAQRLRMIGVKQSPAAISKRRTTIQRKGSFYCSAESRQRVVERTRLINLGKPVPEERKARIAASLRAYNATQEAKGITRKGIPNPKVTEAKIKLWASLAPAEKAARMEKIASKLRGRKRSPEVCARLVEITKDRWEKRREAGFTCL